MINPVKVASGFNTANSFNRCRAAKASFLLSLAEIGPDTIVGLELTNPESMRMGLRREPGGVVFFCWLQQFSKFDSYVPGESRLQNASQEGSSGNAPNRCGQKQHTSGRRKHKIVPTPADPKGTWRRDHACIHRQEREAP